MKRIYFVRMKGGAGYSQPYEVIARTAEEAIKKARVAAKRDGLTGYDVEEVLNRGRAV